MTNGKMNRTITLELTVGEIVSLQELTEDIKCQVEWKKALVESLRQKALAAYKKPFMDADDYADILENERKLWAGEPVEQYMIQGKQREIEFFYDVEEV